MLGKIEDKEEKGMTEDKMAGWHHWLNGHVFEQILGDGEGQGKPDVPQFMGLQKVGHNLAIEQQQIGFCFTLSTQCLTQMWSVRVAQ